MIAPFPETVSLPPRMHLVIIGRAIAKPLGEIPIDNGTFYSSVANVSARAVRTDTGQVVAAAEFTSPAGKGFERTTAGRGALSEAGRMLAREMFSRVGKVWTRAEKPAEFTLPIGPRHQASLISTMP